MNTKIITIVAAVIMLLGLPVANGQIVVIDFESLGEGGDDGPIDIGPTYSEDGFTLTAPTPISFYFLRIIETDNIVLGGAGPTITKDDGGLFDLLSFDYSPAVSLDPLTVTGEKFDGTVITRIINFDDFTQLKTHNFEAFTDLTSISWDRGGYDTFDNIVLIPEPSTLSFLALGYLLFACYRRRTT